MLHILIQVLEDFLAQTVNATQTYTGIRRLSSTNRECYIYSYMYQKIIQPKQRMLHILIHVLEDYLVQTEKECYIYLYRYQKIIQHKQRMLLRRVQVLEDYLAQTENATQTYTGIRRLSSTNRDRMLLILIQVLEDYLAQKENATYNHTCIRRLSSTNRESYIYLQRYQKIIQHKQRMLHILIQVLEDYLAQTENATCTYTRIRRLSSTNRECYIYLYRYQKIIQHKQ